MNLKQALVSAAYLITASAEELRTNPLLDLQKSNAQGDIINIRRASGKIEATIQSSNLSPNEESRKEAEAIKSLLTSLTAALDKQRPQKNSEEAKAVATAFKATFDKFDSIIEENYEFQPGRANISPPPGTPNAAAGMNPDAIEDPVLKQKYLDAFAAEKQKRYKNDQQAGMKTARTELLACVKSLVAWAKEVRMSRDEMLELFTNPGKSRELLREKLGLVKPN